MYMQQSKIVRIVVHSPILQKTCYTLCQLTTSITSWLHFFSFDSSTDDSFVWRDNQGPGSIGDEQDLSDNESQLSGSALVDSCLWVVMAKLKKNVKWMLSSWCTRINSQEYCFMILIMVQHNQCWSDLIINWVYCETNHIHHYYCCILVHIKTKI